MTFISKFDEIFGKLFKTRPIICITKCYGLCVVPDRAESLNKIAKIIGNLQKNLNTFVGA